MQLALQSLCQPSDRMQRSGRPGTKFDNLCKNPGHAAVVEQLDLRGMEVRSGGGTCRLAYYRVRYIEKEPLSADGLARVQFQSQNGECTTAREISRNLAGGSLEASIELKIRHDINQPYAARGQDVARKAPLAESSRAEYSHCDCSSLALKCCHLSVSCRYGM